MLGKKIENKQNNMIQRLSVMDEIRGILIIYVVLYHLLFDISELYGIIDIPWMYASWMNLLRDIMVGILIIISGISCSYSRNNIKRGSKILIIALVITLITAVFSPEYMVIFGVLHFFGTGIILYSIMEKILIIIPPLLGSAICFFLYFFTRHIYEGYMGIFIPIQYEIPERISHLKILYPLGFPIEGLSSGDYYPIIPWIFLLLAGTYLGRIIKNTKLPTWAYKEHSHILSYIGRHTMIIYLIHQPILYIMLYVVYQFKS